jgi:hypothetical protein
MYRRTLEYFTEPQIDDSNDGIVFSELTHPLIAMDFINVDLPEALDPVNSIFCDSEKSLATASAMSKLMIQMMA